ncbi:hypothetical protein [uncultured Flavonifractor sp.]|uniref:hypothetical protein n=1 Tax=uncultured Flavonifractor sp. TaxID=1193534 RepID=UPI002632AB43|nr:hypothetical protein [uncultured Flavonifractor sp.]
MKVPHTRLSTHMSGSAKATEQRLRNLFARHKRPALLLVAVVALAIGLCGGLVACRSTTQAGSFTMDAQYYDVLGNYIEIPRLTAEGEGAQAVNQALAVLKSQYQTVMAAPINTAGGQRCLFYPAVTERYDNLIFYLDSASSGNDGDIYTLVYDRQEDRVVTLTEALELAGTTEDALCRGAEEYLNGELAGTEVALVARDGAVTGFRIRDDGGVEFYLTCMTDDADPAVDAVDGWQHLLVYADDSWRHYNCKATAPLTEELLIPLEELTGFDTPLWYQWGPSSGVPEGGFQLEQIPEQVETQAQTFLEGEGYHAPPDSLLLQVCFDDLSGLELASEWQGYDAMECYRMTYSVPDTYRAVDLLFFRRGEDYTYVGELIGMDYQTVEPTRLASVGPYNYAVMYHLLEEGILTAFPEADAMLRDAPMPLAAQSAAVAYFYSNRPADMTVFFADQAPLQPEGRTMRIDEATYLGLRQLYETYGVVYQLRCSGWEDGGWYAYPEPLWLVFQLGQGGDMTTVLGESVPRKTVEQAALEQGYHLVDGEIALWRDGYPNPAGPGSEVGFFREEPVVTVLEGAEPIYQEGDWWQQMEWEDLSALCYCNADGGYAAYRLETTRIDLFTDRGIRVGSTRAEVEAAYGENLSHTDYWGLYPGEDYLWYCADPEGWGAAILFFFDGDGVSRIVLNNMFN